MVRLLLTGGSGFLGTRLARTLRDDGHDVVLIVRGAEKADAQRFTVLEADVTDALSVKAAFAHAGAIDAVIHLAGLDDALCAKDPALAFAVNCLGTQHVLDASDAKRFIYLSTFHVYGDVAGDISERTVPNPLHMYGITKLAAEQVCKASAKRRGTELAIIRLSNGIGAPVTKDIGRWNLLMLDLCRQAHEKGSLTLQSAGGQLRDFVSIDDLGQALRLLLAADANDLADPVFNVGSGRSVSVRELASTIQAAYENQYGKPLPLHAPELTTQPIQFTYSIDRIKRLGFIPRTDLLAEANDVLRFCEVFR